MAQHFEKLFDKELASQFYSILEVVDDLFDTLADERQLNVKWTTYKEEEYGFYLKSNDNKTSLFCGMYFEAWSITGCPICFSLPKIKVTKSKIAEDLRAIISKEGNDFIKYTEFNSYPLVSFEKGFFNASDYEKKLEELFIRIVNLLKFNVYVNK